MEGLGLPWTVLRPSWGFLAVGPGAAGWGSRSCGLCPPRGLPPVGLRLPYPWQPATERPPISKTTFMESLFQIVGAAGLGSALQTERNSGTPEAGAACAALCGPRRAGGVEANDGGGGPLWQVSWDSRPQIGAPPALVSLRRPQMRRDGPPLLASPCFTGQIFLVEGKDVVQ